MNKPIQDSYPESLAQCYGCGYMNDRGLHIQTFWDGSEGVCKFSPEPHQCAVPKVVYGGLLASLIDCHGTGTAAAAAHERMGVEPGSTPDLRFVTGKLEVSFLKPTPITELTLRGRPTEIKDRKIVVEIDLYANGERTVKGRVVAVKAPADFGSD